MSPWCSYFPKPLRCFKCQLYGHTKKSCKNKIRCSKCGQKGHSESECRSTSVHCYHCSGHHPSYSRECPRWAKEQHIIKVQVRHKISNREAREKVRAEDKSAYANALKSPKPASKQPKPSKAISTQTDAAQNTVDNESFEVKLLNAKVQQLEAYSKKLEKELKEVKAQLSSDTCSECSPRSRSIPDDIRFGNSAKPTFDMSVIRNNPTNTPLKPSFDIPKTPQKSADSPKTSLLCEPSFKASTPLTYERTASFFTADELTPVIPKAKKIQEAERHFIPYRYDEIGLRSIHGCTAEWELVPF